MFPELAAEGDSKRAAWEEESRSADADTRGADSPDAAPSAANGVQAAGSRGLAVFLVLVVAALIVLIVLVSM